MTQKIPCRECQALILPTTAVDNNGLCWPCKRGGRQKLELAKQQWVREVEQRNEARSRRNTLLLELSEYSDDDIIAKLESVAPLLDEDDPVWDCEEYWRDTVEIYLALSDVSAKRRLRPSIRLLLERACFGDPGETMRGLRNRLEAIVSPDWTYLADICIELAASPRKGTRLWAIEQLAILEDPRAKFTFECARDSESPLISEAAISGLARLAK